MKHPLNHRRTRAVTLTELLVVLVIIGLLATLAVPTAITRARQARFATARVEVRALAVGIEAVAMVHGFVVPLQLLDDIPIDDSQGVFGENDDLNNEPASLQLILAEANVFDQIGRQVFLNDIDPRVLLMKRQWAGPFVQPQRVFIGGGFLNPTSSTPSQLTTTQVRRDFPMDPWENPYRLYSPLGIIGSGQQGVLTPPTIAILDSDSWSDGSITRTDDRFDRYAVVSFGPDQISDQTRTSGAVAGQPIRGDDVIYEFLNAVSSLETFLVPGGGIDPGDPGPGGDPGDPGGFRNRNRRRIPPR